MATSSEQITQAVQKLTECSTAFNSKRQEIDDRVDVLAGEFYELTRTFYVDSVNGDDDAMRSGSNLEPLRTFAEAIQRTPEQGALTILLAENYTLTDQLWVGRRDLTIVSVDTESPRRLTLTVFEKVDSTYDEARLSCLLFKGASPRLSFEHVDIEFPTYSGAKPVSGLYATLAASNRIMNKSLIHVSFSRARLIFPPVNGFGYLCSITVAAVCFMTDELVDENSNMTGRYVRGANAGDPGQNTQLITNMATL